MDNIFSKFSWYRLRINLLNIHRSPFMSAHPISIFQAINKGVTSLVDAYETDEKADEDFIFFHIKDREHTYKINLHDEVLIEVLFFGKDFDYVIKWQNAFIFYLSDPVNGRNFDILNMGEIEERNYDIVARELNINKTEGEVCLEFFAPFPFEPEKGRHRTFISSEEFIKSYEKRFSRLFGENIKYRSKDDSFSIFHYYWNYTEIKHFSKSQKGRIQYIKGCSGNLYIKGNFKDFLPFLIIGSEIHIGSKISNSQGYHKLHAESLAFFERRFPNKKALFSVIRDTIERYDAAYSENFNFNEDEFADEIYKEISANTYEPSPNKAFLIKKKSFGERIVEKLNFKDIVVQQYLLKTISQFFDRMLEEESIGFRKGVSREKAMELFNYAVADGCRYVVESDIDDFFPSVDPDKLMDILNFYIPKNDKQMKALLFKCLKNGYTINGEYHDRVRGIAQGSPLSPLFANLYLDSFDEKIKKQGVNMIRYADDFIILTRTEEEAKNILSESETVLSESGLKIKKEKTFIKPIEDGFYFLGMRFSKSDFVSDEEEVNKIIKKPLYITEPYTFLSLNGEAVEITKNRKLIEEIPIRRISEIIAMQSMCLSSALLTKCVRSNIPVTITLNSGYYVTTVKPDSKKYYDIISAHGKKYDSLSETEVIVIAKEIAAKKIKGYISLFRQRYIKGENLFIKDLEGRPDDIYQCSTVEQVRGIEGAAAKKVYHELNIFIDDKSFHIKKRVRRNPDMINSLLNFGYYLLFSRINATLRAVGLNPYLGFLHSPKDNYESLVSDIVELFRARIDRFIIKMINLKVITPGDFVKTQRGFYLKREGVKKFLNQFEREMNRKKKGELSLKEIIYFQVSRVKKWAVEGEGLLFYEWKLN